jgi:hypothetical protein
MDLIWFLRQLINKLSQASGFRVTELDTAYAKGLRPMSYVYSGWAQPDIAASDVACSLL